MLVDKIKAMPKDARADYLREIVCAGNWVMLKGYDTKRRGHYAGRVK